MRNVKCEALLATACREIANSANKSRFICWRELYRIYLVIFVPLAVERIVQVGALTLDAVAIEVGLQGLWAFLEFTILPCETVEAQAHFSRLATPFALASWLCTH